MLERRIAGNGVVYYASSRLEALGVPHAFSTRLGGVSPMPFDSLNLGNPSGCEVADDYERIWENYRRLADACGCEGEILRVHQVHGAVCVSATRDQAFDNAQQADAIILDHPGRVATVRIADCVPVLLSDESGRKVAAVHAGWRGVVGGVVKKAIEAMDAGRLFAAIGPAICGNCFEVGPEVLTEFEASFGAAAPIRRRPDGKGHVDLRAAIQIQLKDYEIPLDHIDATDRCTACEAAEFFSHRRDRGVTGRLAAMISPRR